MYVDIPAELVVKDYFEIPVRYFLLWWRVENSLIPLDGQIITNSNNEWSQDFRSITPTFFSESFLSDGPFNFVHEELTRFPERTWNLPFSDDNKSSNNATKS